MLTFFIIKNEYIVESDLEVGINQYKMANIGNYKGVMLCNRPNEPTAKPKADKTPFISRVTPAQQLGLNPTDKK